MTLLRYLLRNRWCRYRGFDRRARSTSFNQEYLMKPPPTFNVSTVVGYDTFEANYRADVFRLRAKSSAAYIT
jgi:hypothetical protein